MIDMAYISTRGGIAPIGFIDAVLMGLADDGGLLIPQQIPQLSAQTLDEWRKLSYQELALEVFSLYVGGEIPRADLQQLIDDSYSTFRHDEVTPIRRLRDNLYALELFHGPTFAFKDVALQFLGNLYSYISRKNGTIIHILGATSGDTGASAIEGVRGKQGIRICILHPHGKVSKVQELQMTTASDDNVLNLAVEGTFDDCQRIIKELFADVDFKRRHHLRAINSINIARVLAQTVYYFYAYFRLAEQGGTGGPSAAAAGPVNFSVPTGNFGDILAGYMAKRMGLPIGKLVLATNENDILARFVSDGVYEPGEFQTTYSPSMDIQVASNFERYLYYLHADNAEATSALMAQFQAEGRIVVNDGMLRQVQADFAAYSVRNEVCLDTIGEYYERHSYLLDPHTACGVAAAERLAGSGDTTVVLATAHPAKFDEAIRLRGIKQSFPQPIAALFDKPQSRTIVGNDTAAVKEQLERFF